MFIAIAVILSSSFIVCCVYLTHTVNLLHSIRFVLVLSNRITIALSFLIVNSMSSHQYANWPSSFSVCVPINCGIVNLILDYKIVTMRSFIIGEMCWGYLTFYRSYTVWSFFLFVRFCLPKLLSVFGAIIATIAGQAQQQRSNVNDNGAIHFPSEDLYNTVRRTAFSQNPLKKPNQISNTAIQFPSRQAPSTMQTVNTPNPSMPPYQPMNSIQYQSNGVQSSAATSSSLQQNSDIIDFTWELFQVST